MTTTTPPAWLPSGRAFTVADLDALPDDGNRYELIDGALVVSPAPVPRHQSVAFALAKMLDRVCPPDLKVYVAPLDVRLADDTNVQPDVLVARRADVGETHLPVAPVLAVEVLSPSTRTIDLYSKRERLRVAGCASYWAIDPLEGRLRAWDLDPDGAYQQVADLRPGSTWQATRPFAVVLDPASLIED